MATEDFSKRLMTVLKVAVDNFNEDPKHPDDALVKAARDNNFNVEQTRRLVETFNVARTLYHYKSAADRAAPVSLADGTNVVASLFSQPAPYLSEDLTKTAFHVDGYDGPETFLRGTDEPLEKAANHTQFDALFTESNEEQTLTMLSRDAADAVYGIKQIAKTAYEEAGVCGLNASNALTKLASVFSHPMDPVAAHVKYARFIAINELDAEMVPVISKLAEFLDPQWAAPQFMLDVQRARNVISTDGLDKATKYAKEAKHWMEAEAGLLASSGTLEKEAATFEGEWSDAVHGTETGGDSVLLSDFLTVPTRRVKQAADGDDKKEKKAPNPFAEAFFSPLKPAKQVASDVFTRGDSTGVEISRMFTEPRRKENRELSDKLTNIQRQIMLQDLMVNDPVLSDADPENVVQAYSAVLRMSPEVSQNKEVVRAILRQAAHSVAISPYDADMWTKLEQNLVSLKGSDKGGKPDAKKKSDTKAG